MVIGFENPKVKFLVVAENCLAEQFVLAKVNSVNLVFERKTFRDDNGKEFFGWELPLQIFNEIVKAWSLNSNLKLTPFSQRGENAPKEMKFGVSRDASRNIKELSRELSF